MKRHELEKGESRRIRKCLFGQLADQSTFSDDDMEKLCEAFRTERQILNFPSGEKSTKLCRCFSHDSDVETSHWAHCPITIFDTLRLVAWIANKHLNKQLIVT